MAAGVLFVAAAFFAGVVLVPSAADASVFAVFAAAEVPARGSAFAGVVFRAAVAFLAAVALRAAFRGVVAVRWALEDAPSRSPDASWSADGLEADLEDGPESWLEAWSGARLVDRSADWLEPRSEF